MKHLKNAIRDVIVILIVLAFASYLTPGATWDGRMSAGDFRLNIRNAEGKPIKGARLDVYRQGTRTKVFSNAHSFSNYLPDHELLSDENGQITTYRYHSSGFGGTNRDLFWIFPMGPRSPDFDCEITANGYKPLRFSIWQIVSHPGFTYDDVTKENVDDGSEKVEIPIFQQTFVMQK